MKGVKETVELLDAVEVLAVAAVSIGADKKVNMSDLGHVIDLFKNAGVVADGVKGLGDLKAEVTDLDQAELLQLGTRTWALAKACKQAYEENKAV